MNKRKSITDKGFIEIIQEARDNHVITATQQEKILILALKWAKAKWIFKAHFKSDKMGIVETITRMPRNVSQTKYMIVGKNRYVIQIKLKRVEVWNGNEWVSKR